MTSPTDIANVALMEIGSQSTVSSINPSDGSTEGNACSILYTPKIQALHRAAHWNFARKQALLTQLKAAVINGVVSTDPPPIPWLYEYAYPVDCIKARFLMPLINTNSSTSPPLTTNQSAIPLWWNIPAVPFVVGTDFDAEGNTIRVILTNAPQAILVYTADYSQFPDLWDPHFTNAASSYLGAWLVNALARNKDLWADQFRVVKDAVDGARVSDGNEGLTSVDNLPDWMRVRGVLGASFGEQFGAQCYYGWDSVGFPSGFSY